MARSWIPTAWICTHEQNEKLPVSLEYTPSVVKEIELEQSGRKKSVYSSRCSILSSHGIIAAILNFILQQEDIILLRISLQHLCGYVFGYVVIT